MKKVLKTYQEWCIDTLYLLLKNKTDYDGDLRDQGYIYTIKSIINHYASMRRCTAEYKKAHPRCKKEHVNLWWDHFSQSNHVEFFSTLMRSDSAEELLKNESDADKLRAGLHIEHITPCGFIYKRLCKLAEQEEVRREQIEKELKYDHLVLITKKEREALDGGGKFSQKDFDDFKRLFPEFEDELNQQLRTKEIDSTKDSGYGFLRMIHLRNLPTDKGTKNGGHRSGKFYAPNENGKIGVCSPDQWAEFFIKSKMIITSK